jgi:Tfp pilus assembly protein PilX
MHMFIDTLRRYLSVLRGQEGITMIVAIGVMFVTSLLLVATFTAANGEIHLSSTDTSQKKAYYAALAGIENYENHLTEDGNYLTYCTNPPAANAALNQAGETIHRAKILGESGESLNEEYAIQLLPAESAPENDRKCDPNNLVATMLEEKSPGAVGTFRIESTGYSGKAERTLVANFRNANFVSFVWYTKYETGDPAIYGEPLKEKLPATYYTECSKFYGERPADGGEPRRCINNFFINGESVNGPMHTEDHVGVCGSPIFGRTENDRIEFGHAYGKPEDEGYSGEGVCSEVKPVFKGKHVLPKEVVSIEPPPGDEELKHIVEPAYEFTGKTEIILEGGTMTIKTHEVNKTTGVEEEKVAIGVAYPSNGVIYVKQETCPEAYSPYGPKPKYTQDNKCANVYVHGEYTSSLTIASENDVVVNGNLTTPTTGGVPNSNALLGLIANNFVRIYHPVEETYPATGTKKETCKTNGKKEVEKYNSTLKVCEYTDNAAECDAPNASSDLNNPTIIAAMLAVKHAVIVDNYTCGLPEFGNLNVYGAVAGLYTNGFTGVFSGSSIIHGYPYDANYDDRLQVEEPPHFLNPIEASWFVQRETLAPNP